MNLFHLRRTKIVATIGPACQDKKTLLAMVEAGMDVARLNFSHADHATHEKSLNLVREINETYGTNIAILQDLQGPKIRIGNLKAPLKIKEGQIITLRSDIMDQVDDELPIVYDTVARDVKPGDPVLIDDGKVELVVVETDNQHRVRLQITGGDLIQSRKGVNFPDTHISEPTITEKDFEDIEFAIKHKVEWLALSFVRTADDIRLLKELIRLKNGNSKIIAKIEKPEALRNIDEIIKVTDGIMVARGDLGVEIPMEEVPAWQKRIVKKCNKAGKPVIVATQMMESMITNKRPTRSEASDVANALVDGADAVMLSGETSTGRYPVEVVASMHKILTSVEKEEDGIYYRNLDSMPDEGELLSNAAITTACTLARDSQAKAIVGMTRSGFTAIQLSRCRPRSIIYAFTNNLHVQKTLNLIWGVKPFFYDKFVSTDDTIQDVQDILREKGLLEVNDIIVNTGSMPLHEHGLTNMVKIGRLRKRSL
ncbi:MAG: pyruvate kinase [Bacteroidia bacterium]|nr:pyruvate kinase [Bacteroidia bacterium]